MAPRKTVQSQLLRILDEFNYSMMQEFESMRDAAAGFKQAATGARPVVFLIEAEVSGRISHRSGYTPFEGPYFFAARTTATDIAPTRSSEFFTVSTGAYQNFTELRKRTRCDFSGVAHDRFGADLFSDGAKTPYAMFEIVKKSEGGIYLLSE